MRDLTKRLLVDGAHAVGVAAADLAARVVKTTLKVIAIVGLCVLCYLAGAGTIAALFALQSHQVDCTYLPASGPFGQ